MPSSSPTSSSTAPPLLADVAPGLTWLPPFASPESGFRNKAKLVVGGRDRRRDARHPRRRRAAASTCGTAASTSRGLQRAHPASAPTSSTRPAPRAVRRAGATGRAQAPHRHALPRRRADAALRPALAGARRAGSASTCRAAGGAARASRSSRSTSSPSTRPSSRATREIAAHRAGVAAHAGQRHRPCTCARSSFFQTNTAVAAGLYRQAQDWVDDSPADGARPLLRGRRVRPAPAGAGPRRSLGVEVAAEAVASAEQRRATAAGRRSRPRAPTFEAATPPTSRARLTDPAADLSSSTRPGAASAPTWRAGSRTSGCRPVVYSSCNVDILARDLAAMPSLGARGPASSTCSRRRRTTRSSCSSNAAAGLGVRTSQRRPSRPESPAATTEARCVPVQGVQDLR